MSMELTTETGIVCPACNNEFEIKTEGLFGGILKQMFLHGVIGAIAKRNSKGNITVTCGNCGHKFSTKVKQRR